MNQTTHQRGIICTAQSPAFNSYEHAQNYLWLMARRTASAARSFGSGCERQINAAAAFALSDAFARTQEPDSLRRLEALALRDEMAGLCQTQP